MNRVAGVVLSCQNSGNEEFLRVCKRKFGLEIKGFGGSLVKKPRILYAG